MFNSAKEHDVLNIMGAIYATALFLGIFNSAIVLPVLDTERVVFYRERAAGMYSTLPYAFAQVPCLDLTHDLLLYGVGRKNNKLLF